MSARSAASAPTPSARSGWREAGITDEQFARIHGPVGLNIGAKSPAEIAVSILGQIIEVRARRLEALAAPKVAAA